MALRISPSPVNPGGGVGGGGARKSQSRWNSSSSSSSSVSVAAAPPTVSCCSLKHHQQQQRRRRKSGANFASTPAAPLHAAEELASRLGLEMAVEGLERLFRQRSFGDRPPRWGGNDDDDDGVMVMRRMRRGGRRPGCAWRTRGRGGRTARRRRRRASRARRRTSRARTWRRRSRRWRRGRPSARWCRWRTPWTGPSRATWTCCSATRPSASPASSSSPSTTACCPTPRPAPRPSAASSATRRPWPTAAPPSAPSASPPRRPLRRRGRRLLARGALPPDTAVVGSRAAAREFGLRLLRPNLQDRPGNVNRFLQLALLGPHHHPAAININNNNHHNQKNKKTTVAFALRNGPSELFRAMWILESRGVSVTRVDHRPNRSSPVRIVPPRTGGARPCTWTTCSCSTWRGPTPTWPRRSPGWTRSPRAPARPR
uniref:Uncharacterized protein n=1 Tax=Ananas comosus var. bracteatus TaxID=296719 RepID=A0A6V7NE54_ANACO|nr:unnamed protein product [Ananas comosus var. bracteatus]